MTHRCASLAGLPHGRRLGLLTPLPCAPAGGMPVRGMARTLADLDLSETLRRGFLRILSNAGRGRLFASAGDTPRRFRLAGGDAAPPLAAPRAVAPGRAHPI